MIYTHLHNTGVAADYYCAMAQVEQRFAGDGDAAVPAPRTGQLMALVYLLRTGALTESQQQVVQALRGRLLALAHQAEAKTLRP